ncbi:MAG TPA: pitrilysin family protein, partial [Thermodesulfobacteriota bacterium]|nr:pitrilysin family protein [Thermodesulfobacteriota bacterium]
ELSNGVRVVTERIPHAQSVSVGFWVKTGSRDEKIEENGIAHFIEHMLFKGTRSRTAIEIAKAIDSVGGVLNAYTSREYTNFYVKVLEKDIDLALDLLSDIFLNSLFSSQEIDRERDVILQEIRMVEDTPDEYLQDLFNQHYFSGHPLGNPILGSYQTIGQLGKTDLTAFFQTSYLLPGRIVVSIAGKLHHDQAVGAISRTLGSIKPQEEQRVLHVPDPVPDLHIYKKDLEQVHICMGTKGLSQADPSRYAGYLLNAILGGSMSSRLFQEIREKRGLVYAVYSYLSSYSDTGMFSIYAGTTPDKMSEVIELIMHELNAFKLDLLEEDELSKAKDQLKGNVLLSYESTDNRMTRLASGELYFGRYVPIEEVIKDIEKVTVEDVQHLAQKLFRKESFSLAVLGKVKKKDLSATMIRL